MLIFKLLFPCFFEADKGATSGASGDDKPTGDPAGSGSSATTDWRDARIHELNTESANRRRAIKELETKNLELTGQIAQMQTAMTERERTAQETLLRSSVIAAAASAGFHDPVDAWNMLDKTGLKLADGGAVEGLEAALKKVSESKPYLLKVQDAAPKPAPAQPKAKPPSPGNPGSTLKLTLDDLKKMSAEEIRDRWSDPAFQKAVAEANKEA